MQASLSVGLYDATYMGATYEPRGFVVWLGLIFVYSV